MKKDNRIDLSHGEAVKTPKYPLFLTPKTRKIFPKEAQQVNIMFVENSKVYLIKKEKISGMIMDKTMADKLMCIPNVDSLFLITIRG